MSLTNIPNDLRGIIGQYIHETPDDWEAFKSIFDQNGEITQVKRDDVLTRPVWIEMRISNLNACSVVKIHTSLEDAELAQQLAHDNHNDILLTGTYKTVFIQKQMKDLIN